jgi:SlyX protein
MRWHAADQRSEIMQERLTELEIKLAHLEDHIEVLNDAVIRQQGLIETLEQKLARLKDRFEAEREAGADGDPADEKPPHY